MDVSCHRYFFPVHLLNQRWSPPLTLQASHCSTFRIMCDVPSIAVFCSESIECFPGTTSKFFFKLLVTIPVAPVITGAIAHFRFHIRCISIHKLLYFNFFSASFCTTTLLLLLLSLLLRMLGRCRIIKRYKWEGDSSGFNRRNTWINWGKLWEPVRSDDVRVGFKSKRLQDKNKRVTSCVNLLRSVPLTN